MRRVNQFEMFEFGAIARLKTLEIGDSKDRLMRTIILVNNQLDEFTRSRKNEAPQSVEAAESVMAALAEFARLSSPWSEFHAARAKDEVTRFETTLRDEFARMPTFLAEPVGAYSFGQLIGAAETVFAEPLRKSDKIPTKTLEDFRAAGACLAFDQGTACGFHVYRATEAMLRAYCDHFGAVPSGASRDWGRFVQALRDLLKAAPTSPKSNLPNKRTVELLDAIRDVDRNPLVHPELDLTPDEALAAFDMCKVAVTFMAQEMV